jgi:hypothetical protein
MKFSSVVEAIAASATPCASCSPIPDFDPARDGVAMDDLLEITMRWRACSSTRFPPTTIATNSSRHPAAADVLFRGPGGFYLDVLKDRLYTAGKSHARS